ncbi:hypothetical protein L218DRAFT_950968 [Marasmius fiardii PR-910]|nr:hypothetical protein L218DRAFT_950968 [Marasmius fiardii PR-910]
MYYIENEIRSVEDAMWNSDASGMSEAISTLLANESFCPEGGLLGFTLANDYQAYPGQDLNDLLESIGDEDAIVRSVCEDFGLRVSIKTVLRDCRSSDFWHESWSGGLALLDSAVEVSDPLDLDTTLLQSFLDSDLDSDSVYQHVNLIHPYDSEPCYRCSRYGEFSKAIAWIRGLKDGQTGYDLDGVSYRGYPVTEHVEVTLVAAFGPAGDRMSWWDYDGEAYRGTVEED